MKWQRVVEVRGLDILAVNAKGSEGLTGRVRGPRLGLTLLSLALLLTWLYSLLKVCISRRRHWKEEKRSIFFRTVLSKSCFGSKLS